MYQYILYHNENIIDPRIGYMRAYFSYSYTIQKLGQRGDNYQEVRKNMYIFLKAATRFSLW